VVAALVAGNAVIVVADQRAPLIVQSIVNVAATAGIPDALIQAVVGGPRVVDNLATQADAIVSYGPAVLTRRLARVQGARLIPVLGRWPTRDVMLVLSDADLQRAARAAVSGACTGGGRPHRSLTRIYVQDTVLDPFVDAVVEEVGRLRTPHAMSSSTSRNEPTGSVGPLFDRDDLQVLEALIEEATSSGARLVAGGRTRPRSRGFFFEPTVLTGVDEEMDLWKTPSTGPIVAIATFGAPAEAVLRTRSLSDYGQVAIFSRSRSVIDDLVRRLDAPLIGVNTVISEIPADSPIVEGTWAGPPDPVGASRLRPLSHRVMQVEDRLGRLVGALHRRPGGGLLRAMDSALALVHRQGLIRRTTEAIWPPR
jgi:acyl-CoA reductase-like NAD-dependent aldehyde dehydrogenase